MKETSCHIFKMAIFSKFFGENLDAGENDAHQSRFLETPLVCKRMACLKMNHYKIHGKFIHNL
jgi:hypothetical protein